MPNTGRSELAVVPSLTWGVTKHVTVNALVRIPLDTRIREDSMRGDVQLAEPIGVFVGLSYNF